VAIAVIGEMPGGNAETDQAMMQQLGVSPTSPPAGSLARMAGPMEGGWRIISVWESQEAWDTFRRERLEAAFQQMGRPAPSFQVWQIETFFTPQK